ncbi:MAG TPA: glycosyltransferase family 39 protein [Holophaga sp.]|nr:glycosyltransferase family 39 protein [Holophaga sp.]
MGRGHWFWTAVAGVVLVFFGLGLHGLGSGVERDFDEGVYWLTLRCMSHGYRLYEQAFYSQPSGFLPAIYPIYALFGKTIWAARLGVLVISLLGLAGAAAIGMVLRGRAGALIALLAMATSPVFLAASRTLQADAPVTALMLLSVGSAYLWWRHPDGKTGCALASLAAFSLVWCIFAKLFGLAAAVPVLMLAAAHLVRIRKHPAGARQAGSASLLVGLAVTVLAVLLFLLPFHAALPRMWDQVVSFHMVAKGFAGSPFAKGVDLKHELLHMPLVPLAAAGAIIVLVRKDRLALPLLGWLLATLVLLWQQVPLFRHHLVVLVPPMALMATPAIALLLPDGGRLRVARTVVLLAGLYAIGTSLPRLIRQTVRVPKVPAAYGGVVAALEAAVRPDERVVTDAQFLAALADRLPPPRLVDTSFARILTGSLTVDALIEGAGDRRVKAVLFYRTRKQRESRLASVPAFRAWVAAHCHLVVAWDGGCELWIKN